MTLKNAKIGLFYYSIALVAQFIARKVFLDNLGDEFIGLTETIKSIIGFLNLAELGIGTVIGFALYPHFSSGNREKIKEVVALLNFLYHRIGLFITLLGVVFSFFIPWVFTGLPFDLTYVYLYYYTFLAATLLTYFINYRILVLEADQKSYVVFRNYQVTNILRLLVQSAVAYYLQSFLFWILADLFFAILFTIKVNRSIAKEYPWLPKFFKKPDLSQYKVLIKKIKQSFVHKMATFVLDGTDQIVIFALIGVNTVTFFTNYQLIFKQVNNLLNIVFRNSEAGIGNLVAEGDNTKSESIFWEMTGLRYLVGGFFTIAIYLLLGPFIELWIGEKYILAESTLILLSVTFFINQVRAPVDHYIYAYGLFHDTWAPITEAILNLFFSLILGYYIGLDGILIATLISLVFIIFLWKPYFLYSSGFKANVKRYYLKNAPLLLSFLIALFSISYIFKNYIESTEVTIKNWLIDGVLVSILIIAIYFPLLFALNKESRLLLDRVKNLLR